MSSAAVIIGINGYPTQPLTSCVNDALAFRSALLELGLVGEGEVTLLTSPLVAESSGTADGDTIRAALLKHYEQSDHLDRLFVYFAGHGMSGQKIGVVQGLRAVLVPVDVADFANHGNKMIDLDELHDYFRLVGPTEQFYFIDACRNLVYERRPSIGTLGWAERPPQRARSQTTLYAVAELGEAGATRGGHGFFTEHLVAALRGTGSALDYDPSAGWVITPQSVRDYVAKRIQTLIDRDPQAMVGITVPQLVMEDPPPAPLRVASAPEDVEVIVHVEPEMAAAATTVFLSYGPYPLPDARWPPLANHTPVRVRPLLCSLEATSDAGQAEPSRRVLDVREEREATVRISQPGGGAQPADAPHGSGPALAHLEVRGGVVPSAGEVDGERLRDALRGTGWVEATALESVVSVDVTQRQPPYRSWTATGELRVEVPVGAYVVTFRLGEDTFSSQEIFVGPGETAVVDARVAPGSLMRDVLGVPTEVTDGKQFSESIGPIQAGMVETMLPIIGIKPFDIHNEVFGTFSDVVPERVDPSELGDCALSLVVAVDGDQWPVPLPEMLRSVRATVSAGGVVNELELHLRETPYGAARILSSVTRAEPGSLLLEVAAPQLGWVSLNAAALPGRATVLSLRYEPTGRLEVAQNILRFPRSQYPDEPVAHLSYGQVLRDLQLGMRLYGNGDLVANGNTEVLQSLLYAKWSDPILGCMAVFSLLDAAPPEDRNARAGAAYSAHNLVEYFPWLPDGHVAKGLTHPAQRDTCFEELLERDAVPVLARAARELGARADQLGRTGTRVQDAVRRIPDRQPWTLARTTASAPY